MKMHKHFKLIVLWAVGFTIQEKYYWYKDWVDVDGWTPPFDDPDCLLRVKDSNQYEGVDIDAIHKKDIA